jgi:hypothetical protein
MAGSVDCNIISMSYLNYNEKLIGLMSSFAKSGFDCFAMDDFEKSYDNEYNILNEGVLEKSALSDKFNYIYSN